MVARNGEADLLEQRLAGGEPGADNEYEVDGHFYGCRSSVGRSVLSVCERSVNGGYSGHLCHLQAGLREAA